MGQDSSAGVCACGSPSRIPPLPEKGKPSPKSSPGLRLYRASCIPPDGHDHAGRGRAWIDNNIVCTPIDIFRVNDTVTVEVLPREDALGPGLCIRDREPTGSVDLDDVALARYGCPADHTSE